VLGIAGTIATGGEPGSLLGFFVIVGSVVAALGIRRRRVHMILPLPALLLFIGAVVTGAVHDRAVDTSTTEFGVNFLQWIANVFFTMCVATILVLVIIGARWVLSRVLVSGQFSMSGGPRPRPSASPRPDGVRPGRGPRDERRAGGGALLTGPDGRGARANPEQPDNQRTRGTRGAPPDRDRRRDGGDPWDPRTWGGDRTQRDDRPRPTY
jgi:hypothetical protein